MPKRVSSASKKLKTTIKATKIYPVESDKKTIAMEFNSTDAADLALAVLSVARQSPRFVITAFRKNNQATVTARPSAGN